jgi:CRP-like cAMP-binding protein
MSSILQTLREVMTTPADQLDALYDDRCDIRGRADQALFHSGDPSDAVYLLVSGFARGYVGEGQSSRTTLLIKAPALLGDRDVLAGCNARDTVRLVSKSKLITWSREDFIAEWTHSPELRALVTDDMARRYATTIRWIELDSLQLTDRLSTLLNVLGGPQPSIDELAAMLGLSRRSIFRALAELRERSAVISDDAQEEKVSLVHSLAPDVEATTRRIQAVDETDTEDTSDSFDANSIDRGEAACASL